MLLRTTDGTIDHRVEITADTSKLDEKWIHVSGVFRNERDFQEAIRVQIGGRRTPNSWHGYVPEWMLNLGIGWPG